MCYVTQLIPLLNISTPLNRVTHHLGNISINSYIYIQLCVQPSTTLKINTCPKHYDYQNQKDQDSIPVYCVYAWTGILPLIPRALTKSYYFISTIPSMYPQSYTSRLPYGSLHHNSYSDAESTNLSPAIQISAI